MSFEGQERSKRNVLDVVLRVPEKVGDLNRIKGMSHRHKTDRKKESGVLLFDELYYRINKQWEVGLIALEQLTSHLKQAHNNGDPSRLR